jgi:KipI family sensor histidine kinase inhibitor
VQHHHYTIYACGTNAITLSIGESIDALVNAKIMALAVALQQQAIVGVKDIIPAYNSLTVVYDAFAIKKAVPTSTVFEWMQQLIENTFIGIETNQATTARLITIPVCYDASLAPDLATIAAAKMLTFEQIIHLHTSTTYHVYMLGFLPGFAYMGSVSAAIQMPRLSQPRTYVPAGSVGIAGEQTGIYPLDSPGGWNIIGQTPIRLFDAAKASPTVLLPGDQVQFEPISLAEFQAIKKEQQQPNLTIDKPIGINIVKAGIADSIKDIGRFGYQDLGINPTAAMDIVAAQVANFLVGNNGNEAVMELHFPASTLLMECDVLIALSGADFNATLDNQPIAINKPFWAKRSSLLAFTKPISGHCCYLAVHGGFELQPWLNSTTTNRSAAAGGYHGRYLKTGDTIGVKSTTSSVNINSHWQVNLHQLYLAGNRIRVTKGPAFNLLTQAAQQQFRDTNFRIDHKSNAMGLQLKGANLALATPKEMISSAVVMGTIQLLPDGHLIVLMADHQTTGGYPVIGYVAAVDLPKLAQMTTNAVLDFTMIDMSEAENLYVQQQQYLRQLQVSCNLKLEATK